MGLSNLGFRAPSTATPAPALAAIPAPAPAPDVAAIPAPAPAPDVAAIPAPAPEPAETPAAPAPEPASPELAARKPTPSSPELTRPSSSPELPPLVDEGGMAPEPDDPLAQPGSWTKLDAPQQPSGDAPPTQPPPVSAEPASAAAPAAAPRGRTGVILVAVAVIVALTVAAWVFLGRDEPSAGGPTSATETRAPAAVTPGGDAPPATTAAPSSAPSSSSAAPAATSSAGPMPSTDTTATAEVAATPAPEAGEDVAACMMPLFAKGTFKRGASPDFGFVCSEADPRRGVAAIKKQVVLAGAKRNVSEGMREWALLGWYELASYSVMRARCCPGAPPLKLPAPPPPCQPLETALDELGAAALVAKTPKDKALEAAVKRYTKEVYCLVRAGGTSLFGYVGPPKGGEVTAFRKTLARAVKKR